MMSEMTDRVTIRAGGARDAFSSPSMFCVVGKGASVSAADLVGKGDMGVTIIEAKYGRGVPAMIPRSQAYYWSRAWQAGEAEALEDLAAGRSRVFDDPRDLARYLLSADDA